MDKLIEEGVKVDCILTDVPYGTTACKWDTIIPFEPMWERINKLIISNAKDKTMIIIAHRLSTVVDADIIYLVREGQILESGSHKQLMELNGRYAYMFNVQKKLYEEK